MLRKIFKKIITTVNDFYEYIHYLLRIHEIFLLYNSKTDKNLTKEHSG